METTKFKKILIPTDFSKTAELAIEKACRIAAKFDSDLYVLHTIESNPYKTVYPENSKEDVILQKYVMDKMEGIASTIFSTYKINVTTLVGESKPIEVIEGAVKDNKIDLIVMGTHGAGGLREYLLGSNAQKVVHSSVCPVLTIKKETGKTDMANIIMPIKNWENTLEKVDYVIELASVFHSKVHLLEIEDSKRVEDIKKINELAATAEKKLQKANVDFIRVNLKTTHDAKDTVEYGRKVNADLIVVMTEHESHLSEPIPYLFVRQILNHSEIPVMSIKPAMYHAEHVSFHKEPVHRGDHRKDPVTVG